MFYYTNFNFKGEWRCCKLTHHGGRVYLIIKGGMETDGSNLPALKLLNWILVPINNSRVMLGFTITLLPPHHHISLSLDLASISLRCHHVSTVQTWLNYPSAATTIVKSRLGFTIPLAATMSVKFGLGLTLSLLLPRQSSLDLASLPPLPPH